MIGRRDIFFFVPALLFFILTPLVLSPSSVSLSYRGRVDDLSFFDYLSPFCFLLIEFHCYFYISYKILPDYVYCYCISIRM